MLELCQWLRSGFKREGDDALTDLETELADVGNADGFRLTLLAAQGLASRAQLVRAKVNRSTLESQNMKA
ncbi:MAG TPA: hypothetical protein EYQ22_06010 [Gammaproteobacteria bacterium]|nr:hypothetical protein [Gammaproteobacteria bacterium]HIK69949.1 hypothetical protein [Pseudomonadales bacterium]|tara:strand:- start:92 stop:301 length:210 start_codon:yes stop_codon:yes gene_type:complete